MGCERSNLICGEHATFIAPGDGEGANDDNMRKTLNIIAVGVIQNVATSLIFRHWWLGSITMMFCMSWRIKDHLW